MSGETRIASVLLPRMKSRLRVAAVNDFDGDGNSDLLWYDSAKRSLRLWLIDHARLRSDLDLGLAPKGAKVFASGDYDGNGNADLLWRDGNQALTLWLLRNARRSKVIDVGHFIRDQKLVP